MLYLSVYFALIFNLDNFLNIPKNTEAFLFFKARINHMD